MTHPDYFKDVELKARDTQVAGNHYKGLKIQVSDYVYENNFNWYVSNAIKYLSRYDKKHSDKQKQLEDLNKAIHYIYLLIDKIEQK
jgi:hypothetical protein